MAEAIQSGGMVMNSGDKGRACHAEAFLRSAFAVGYGVTHFSLNSLRSLSCEGGWKAGHDPEQIRYGCCLSALTGLAKLPPAPTFRGWI